MKVLLVTLYFPPAGGGGVQRPLKLATHLPELGIETHVLAPDDPKWIHRAPVARFTAAPMKWTDGGGEVVITTSIPSSRAIRIAAGTAVRL